MGSTFTPGRMMGSLLLFVAFLVCWQWGPGLMGIKAYMIPPLSQVATGVGEMWESDRLLYHTGVTALEVVAGFFLGAVLGMIVGYALGMSFTAEVVLSPYILALQIAPKVAFAPLFILWLGFGVSPKILVAVLIVFFPIMINVMTAVRTVDPDLINLARSFTATRAQIFWRIEFPASMPPLFAGLRISATLAVIGVTVGELVGGNIGLGYLLVLAAGSAETAKVFGTIILMTVIGIAAYLVVAAAERHVLHYLPSRGLQSF